MSEIKGNTRHLLLVVASAIAALLWLCMGFAPHTAYGKERQRGQGNARCPNARPLDPSDIGLGYRWIDFSQEDIDKDGKSVASAYGLSMQKGVHSLVNDEYDRAIFYFSQASKTGSMEEYERSPSYLDRGVAYAELKQYNKALEDFNIISNGLVVDPFTYGYAYYNIGIIYIIKHRYDEAISSFNRAERASIPVFSGGTRTERPSCQGCNFNLPRALIYYNTGQYSRAWQGVHDGEIDNARFLAALRQCAHDPSEAVHTTQIPPSARTTTVTEPRTTESRGNAPCNIGDGYQTVHFNNGATYSGSFQNCRPLAGQARYQQGTTNLSGYVQPLDDHTVRLKTETHEVTITLELYRGSR